MPEDKKHIGMRLSPEICEWLDQKASIGYGKGAIVQLILTERMNLEKAGSKPTDGDVR